MTDARDHERRLFDRFRNDIKRFAAHFFERPFDNARTGDADVNGEIALRYAVERARHERIIFDRVAERHELGATQSVVVGG